MTFKKPSPMSSDTKTTSYKKSVLEFKSMSLNTLVLVVSGVDFKQIEIQLKEKISQAPEFFKHASLLIDLKNSHNQEQSVDISALVKWLLEKKIFPIGISGGDDEQNKQAITLNIPIHTIRPSYNSDTIQQQASEKDTEPVNSVIENKLISLPIRSGQRVYARGDLTILSHVSAGAEVMAEGNIHVYGALRGRALAGVQGDISSRIFCADLQAELVSVAGYYKISEELDKKKYQKPTQVFLQGEVLIIETLYE